VLKRGFAPLQKNLPLVKGKGKKGMGLEMGERLRLIASLLMIAVMLAAGCTTRNSGIAEEDETTPEEEPGDTDEYPITPVDFWFPDSLRWLTDREKEKAIEIALHSPEALEWQQKEGQYKVEISWLAMYPDSSGDGYVAYRTYEYETVETGIPTYPPGRIVAIGDVQKDAEIYPKVNISSGDPLRWIVSVAVDLDEEKVVYTDEYPPRYPPGYSN
jgi:hypothetical protein